MIIYSYNGERDYRFPYASVYVVEAVTDPRVPRPQVWGKEKCVAGEEIRAWGASFLVFQKGVLPPGRVL